MRQGSRGRACYFGDAWHGGLDDQPVGELSFLTVRSLTMNTDLCIFFLEFTIDSVGNRLGFVVSLFSDFNTFRSRLYPKSLFEYG